jgi:hypothetical protein
MNPVAFDELPEELRNISKKVDFDEDDRIGTSFDELPEELKQIARQVDFEDDTFLGSLGKAATEVPGFGVRGFAEGLGTPGSLLELTGLLTTEQLPGEQARARAETELADRPALASLISDDDILPSRFQPPTSRQTREIAELLGTPREEPETFGGRGAQRLGRAAGAATSFGGGGLPLFLGAATTGAVAEELTGSELTGDITEIVASLRPDKLFAKKVPTSVGIKPGRGFGETDLVNVGRKFGMTEAEIAAITQNPTRTKSLLKLGTRTSKLEKLGNSIDAKLGDAYGKIKDISREFPNIGGRTKQGIIVEAEKAVKDLRKTVKPSEEKKKAIEFLTESIEELQKSEVDPEKLINWWQDINKSINWKKIGANKSATKLKEPIINALDAASPKLAQDFESLNELYSNFKKISNSLKPDTIDRVVKLGEAATLVGSVFTLNPTVVGSVLLGVAGRRAATAMATNPRYMNIFKKGMEALADQKTQKVLQIGRKLTEMMINDFGEDVVNEELLMQMFSHDEQSTQNQ